jgi:alpha-N-acetylglucosamine transferase
LPSPFSYVFYATNDDYACSALVNVQRLQTLFHTTARIVLLATSSVSDPFLAAFRARNVTVFIHEAPPLADGSVDYYQDVLLKLISFKLHHFDPSLKRILVLDAD